MKTECCFSEIRVGASLLCLFRCDCRSTRRQSMQVFGHKHTHFSDV